MVLFKRNNPATQSRQANNGLSLLEMALGMMILAILSIAVSALVKNGVEAQLARRTHQEIQTVGLNIVDDLRHDIRTANRATASGNQLVLEMPPIPPATSTYTITYQLTGNNLSRTSTATGASKTYNVGPSTKLRVTCSSPCFRAAFLNSANNPRQIVIDSLQVSQILPNQGTAIDQAFGTANFSIRKFSFEILSAKEFQ